MLPLPPRGTAARGELPAGYPATLHQNTHVPDPAIIFMRMAALATSRPAHPAVGAHSH